MPSPLMQCMMSWTKMAADNRYSPVLMLCLNEKSQGVMVLSPGMAQQMVQVHGVGRPWPDNVRKLADDLLEAVADHLNIKATEEKV